MRADGGSRPTYYPRGLIVSTGEDVPSGQSLRARMIVLELAPGDIDTAVLSRIQRMLATGFRNGDGRLCAVARAAHR